VDPKDLAQQFHARALTAYNAQNYSVAEELLRRAMALVEDSPRLRAHLALALAEQPGRIQEAEQLAEAAFEDDPLEAQCLEALGLIKLKQGAYGPAGRLLEKALLLDRRMVPSSAKALAELKAHAQRKGGTADKLWAMVRKMIHLKP
jgi:tetratricopeptide (TPR) repeat protein